VISAGEHRTALYRFYDADEQLLYVGITSDPWRRWRQHVLEKAWYPQVKHQAVTWYDSRIRAELAEQSAIRCERPRFNIAGAVRPVADEVSPEPAPEPAPGPLPAAAPPVPPLVPVPADHRRRTFVVLMICFNWALLPSMPGMPHSWHSPGMQMLAWSTIVPVLLFFLIAGARPMQQFGGWLDRTFTTRGAES